MNIEATSTATATKTADASTSTTNTTPKDDSTSFKDQLEAAKTQDSKAAQTKEAETTKTADEAKTVEATDAQKNTTKQQETAKTNITQQTAKDKLTKENNTVKNKEVTDPIAELNSKIATISELKSGISKTQSSKTKETTDKNDHCATIKMDSKDTAFFLNLVQNQQMSAQAGQASTSSQANTTFTDIKSEATQKTVQVSSTLLDAMNEASKTGKSVRIDFDKDVAVIMKVDKNGTLSANFIPGDAAVENYLRNNIEGLKQSFNDQGLAYNELSYSKQQNQEQNGQQEKQKNNKENENE